MDNKVDWKCPQTKGSIKAILFQPWSDFNERGLSKTDLYLQIGDSMTNNEGDKCLIGHDVTYIKMIDDGPK